LGAEKKVDICCSANALLLSIWFVQGFGFLTFESEETAEMVVGLRHVIVNGKKVLKLMTKLRLFSIVFV
jgi:hypothetical protein